MTGRHAQKDTGQPPGTLIHIGKKRQAHVRITVTHYNKDAYVRSNPQDIAEAVKRGTAKGVHWINIEGIHDVRFIEALGKHYALHPLLLEDIMNTTQTPKVEHYDNCAFIVMKALHSNSNETRFEHISIVLGKGWVLSFQEEEGDTFDVLHERLAQGRGRVRANGADYLTYTLMDSIIDEYFTILGQLSDRTEHLEAQILEEPTPKTLAAVQALKREMVHIQHAIRPLRDIINALLRDEFEFFEPSTRMYMRDAYDHVTQAMDTLNTFREIISDLTELYMSTVSNRMNEVMKVLTIIATIFIPLTFITGVYGMNFHYMPELDWRHGYFIVLGLMMSIGLLMIMFFRRKGWV